MNNIRYKLPSPRKIRNMIRRGCTKYRIYGPYNMFVFKVLAGYDRGGWKFLCIGYHWDGWGFDKGRHYTDRVQDPEYLNIADLPQLAKAEYA